MKTITTFGIMILAASLLLSGITNSVSAQEDAGIYLKIAKRAQEQISNQISSDSPDKIKELFEEGVRHVNALEDALKSDNPRSAKEHFISAMNIFKEISRHLNTTDAAPKTEAASVSSDVRNPTSDLKRLYAYVENLKTIAKKHHSSIDFSELDRLFSQAREQVSAHDYADTYETLHEIKQVVIKINKELREEASKQESERAKAYAQKYLEQLDRLIENAKKQGVSDEIIEKLENAKENLSSASSPAEIVKEIRKIMSIKDQFELTKNDRLESRVLQVEKTISRLSQVEGVDQENIDDAYDTLNSIKRHLSQGEFDSANELLRELAKQLNEIKNSLR